MQHHLKTLSKNFSLFALSCTLLLLVLFGLQQHVPTASAAATHSTSKLSSAGINPICQICILTYDLYTVTGSGIWGHDGTLSALIDDNQIGMTNGGLVSGQFGAITAVIARGSDVYEVRQPYIFQIVFGGCSNTATSYCLTELDNNQTTVSVAAGGTGFLYQTRTDGSVWQLTSVCFHCWTLIDNNNAVLIVAAAHLYELRGNATIWRYNGCGNQTCWTEIDSNPTINNLAVGTNGVLYELRAVFSNGNFVSSSILKGIGPFNFQPLDTVDLTERIVASTRLYQVDQVGGTLMNLLYQGGNPAWENLGTASGTFVGNLEPGTASDAVYEMHGDNSIWEFTPEMNKWIEIVTPANGGKMSEPSGFILFFL